MSLATIRKYLPSASFLIALTALLAGALLAARSWLEAHDQATRLAATLAAQAQVLTQADQRERQRDAQLAAQLKVISQAKRRVDTPARAAAEIPQLLPPLPEPMRIDLPPPTPAQPAPPAVATLPLVDLQPLYDSLQDCRACQASLAASRDDLIDERSKLAAITAERDAALSAARGGNFWSRLRHNAKWLAAGAAAAAIASSIH